MGIRLFVDDIRKEPDGWVRARSVTEAIRILDTMDVEEVSLDHDIQCEVRQLESGLFSAHASPETFEPVVRYLARVLQKRVSPGGVQQSIRITIHTANNVAAERMRQILGPFDAKIEPVEAGR